MPPLADYDAYAVDNWDGYEAQPITSETVHAARTILRSLPETHADLTMVGTNDDNLEFIRRDWLQDVLRVSKPEPKCVLDVE